MKKFPFNFRGRLASQAGFFMLSITSSIFGGDKSTVDASRFGLRADSGKDATPAVREAIETCRREKAGKLVFAPGRYDFWPERAAEKYLSVSNNDAGLRRIGFPLIDIDGLEIDGSGAVFVFHAPMVPFLIDNSHGITLKNLSFDFVRPFHSEAKLLSVTPTSAEIEISSEFPYLIRNGVLVFTNGKKRGGPLTTESEGEIVYPYGTLLAFDAERKETAYMAQDRYGLNEGIAAVEVAPGRVRLVLDQVPAKPGDILVFGASLRSHPGIVINESAGVRLEDVNIYHCGGMGVIAQMSADILLDHVRVTPSPGGKRIVSITADATHFVNCRGGITLRDCLFENQKDDATNVHGLYAQITEKLAPNRFEIRLVHHQQAGLVFIKPGTRLELTDGPSLQTLGEARVKFVEQLNGDRTIVTTQDPLPEGVEVGDAVADADANTADVLIERCVIRNNRARGILLGSRGKTEVIGNTFHTPGAAILFEGDARFWFEQAGARNVTIRGNTFDNCNFGVWGKATIEVGSGIEKGFRHTTRYNHNISISDNLFRVFGPQPLLSLYSVDGVDFRNNRLEQTKAYPPKADDGSGLLVITDSDKVRVEQPVGVVVGVR